MVVEDERLTLGLYDGDRLDDSMAIALLDRLQQLTLVAESGVIESIDQPAGPGRAPCGRRACWEPRGSPFADLADSGPGPPAARNRALGDLRRNRSTQLRMIPGKASDSYLGCRVSSVAVGHGSGRCGGMDRACTARRRRSGKM